MKPGVLGEWKDPNDCDFSRVFTRHVNPEYAKLVRTENIETGHAKKNRRKSQVIELRGLSNSRREPPPMGPRVGGVLEPFTTQF